MSDRRNYEQGEGKDWNVKGSIAFGKGAVHADFMGLQHALNRYASLVGFGKLETDGFIGENTVEAWQKTYKKALEKDPLAALAIMPIQSKEQMATLCQHVRHWLDTTGAKILGAPTA